MHEPVREIITLDLDPEESKILWRAVEVSGYEQNLDGFKNWVFTMLNIHKQPTPSTLDQNTVSSVVNFCYDNPELVKKASQALMNTLKRTFKK